MKITLLSILFIFESFMASGCLLRIDELLLGERLSPYDRSERSDSSIEIKGFPSDSVATDLFEDVLISFSQKYVQDTELQNTTLSTTHRRLNDYYAKIKQYDHALKHLRLSQKHIEQTKNLSRKAEFWRYAGIKEGSYGNSKLSVEALFRAVKYFEMIPGSEQSINACLDQITVPFLESGDWQTVLKIALKMERIARRSADSMAYYHYYSTMGNYYSSIAMSASVIDKKLVVRGISYLKRAIEIIKQHPSEIYNVTPALWTYYKVAEGYSLIGDLHSKDSVVKYLALAQRHTPSGDDQATIAIKKLLAQQYLNDGYPKQAEAQMLEVLSIIEAARDNSFVVERCNTYDFLSGIAQTQGDLLQALSYQKLFTEAHLERFNMERNEALCELSIRYETEQKEAQIELLKQEKRYVESVILWFISFLALFLIGLSLVLYIFHLRKRANIQQLYEKAMEAEIRLQALNGSIKNAAQQIQPNRENLLRLVEKSILEPPIKADYYKRIEELDPQAIETIQQCAKSRLSPMDIKYMVCFMVGIEVAHVALIFSVEPASVHTVRYRIRKKLPPDMLLF